ncbi:MAG: hypothetical protein ACK4GN_14385 [Runella sp.]
MKTQIALFVWLVLCLGACKKEDPEKEGPCGVKNPIEDLEWLKKEIELYSQKPNISQAYFSTIYQSQRVFWYYSFSNAGDLQYRFCDGTRRFIPSPLPTDEESKAFMTLLWAPDKACQFLIWSTPEFRKTSTCK